MMSDAEPTPLPMISDALARVCGTLKDSPEDFEVEEVPAYEPCGEGEHLYLWVQKRDMTGPNMVKLLARHLGVREQDLGVAGIKDRRAVTRQWVSAHGVARPAEALVGPVNTSLTILSASRHRNKLRRGHLRGNRFTLTLRQVTPDDEATLRARLDAKFALLMREGIANYYGDQRFGRGGSTLALGLGLLRDEEQAKRQVSRNPSLRRLALNSVQSEGFNLALAARLARGPLQVEAGDIVQRRDSGGMFVVSEADLAETRERMARGEVVLTGPMLGPKMLQPQGLAAEREAQALASLGASAQDFAPFGALAEGTRRPLVVFPEQLEATLERASDQGMTARMTFFLPSGAYATILCEELAAGSP